MTLPRVEINLRRLLSKCELMVQNKDKEDDRFPKYIESLELMFKELQHLSNSPNRELLIDYNRRIIDLKTALGLEPEGLLENKLSEGTFGNVPLTAEKTREELLGLRQRKVEKSLGSKDMDELITYHQDMQDKIAGEMLKLTQNLKEQSLIANKIIKKDTEIVSRSAELSDGNFAKLKTESIKLEEHSKRACKCWMWVMLVVVMVVFINMVLFMKVMKKS